MRTCCSGTCLCKYFITNGMSVKRCFRCDAPIVVTYVITCVIAYVITYCITYAITHVITYLITYLITYGTAYVIAYPYAGYAWTENFEMRLEMQFRSYQPPIPTTSQASAWSYKYIGRWMGKTEGSSAWLGENFGRLNGWTKTLGTSCRFGSFSD